VKFYADFHDFGAMSVKVYIFLGYYFSKYLPVPLKKSLQTDLFVIETIFKLKCFFKTASSATQVTTGLTNKEKTRSTTININASAC
jgi:hypothetical protein